MDWNRLLNSSRLGRTGSEPENGAYPRNEFQSDINRITFSPSFRRLAQKTQVFPLSANDHIHNRLTHSLEVSRVGRTLGTEIGRRLLDKKNNGVNIDPTITAADIGSIVEAASLAHDIGHPPFGHAGERAIKYWFENSEIARKIESLVTSSEFNDLKDFDGNAQGFRRLTQLDKNVFKGGLNLTLTSLAAYIKYPTYIENQNAEKRGYFFSERKIVEEIVKELDLTGAEGGLRHPLSYLVEAADDMCYGLLDLEDAVEMKILSLKSVSDDLLKALPDDIQDEYRPKENEQSHRVVFARMRGKVFRQAIDSVIKTFEKNYEKIMAGEYSDELLQSAEKDGYVAAKVVNEAKKRAKNEVFQFDDKVNIELSAIQVIGRLLDSFTIASSDFAKNYASSTSDSELNIVSNTLLSMMGDHRPQDGNEPPGEKWSHYQCIRRAIDYVSGMTDRFAVKISNQLAGNIGK